MRQELLDLDGVLLRPCRSIHTLGMTRAIDVVFLDSKGTVREVRLCVGPFRVVACQASGMLATLELAAGRVQRVGIGVGDQIIFM
jgi:uncharacterized protein